MLLDGSLKILLRYTFVGSDLLKLAFETLAN
jgi:hypothetical protein